MIGDDMKLSERLSGLLAAHPDIEVLTQSLSITTFRYIPPDLRQGSGSSERAGYLNILNEKLLEKIQGSGEAYVSNAVIGGRYVLRACIVNFNTTRADVEALPEIVARHGRDVDARLRTIETRNGSF
jgi:aromatic-L-amino-acid/L-tryptophan decarboxylase